MISCDVTPFGCFGDGANLGLVSEACFVAEFITASDQGIQHAWSLSQSA